MAKDDAEKVGMGCLLVILLTPPAVIFRGFVLTRLWAWFAVPFGAPAIGIATAVGLMVVGGLLTFGRRRCDDPDESVFDKTLNAVAYGFGVPALSWLAGWACHLAATYGS